MTRAILVSVAAGMLAGYFFIPDALLAVSGVIMTVGLSALLFFVGMDLGRQGNILAEVKKAGWRVFLIPVAVAAGTLAAGVAAGLFLPFTPLETAVVSAGFGWYSFAPIVLADYSAGLSAVSFLHNVMRELAGIILIPVVARYVGYIEAVGLPGAAAMDVCLPIVEKSTSPQVAIYSFFTGSVISVLVLLLVPFLTGLLQG